MQTRDTEIKSLSIIITSPNRVRVWYLGMDNEWAGKVQGAGVEILTRIAFAIHYF